MAIYCIRKHINPDNGEVFYLDVVEKHVSELNPVGMHTPEYHLYCLNNDMVRRLRKDSKECYYTAKIEIHGVFSVKKDANDAKDDLYRSMIGQDCHLVNRMRLYIEEAEIVDASYKNWRERHTIKLNEGGKRVFVDVFGDKLPRRKPDNRMPKKEIKVFNMQDGTVYDSLTSLATRYGLSVSAVAARMGIVVKCLKRKVAKVYSDGCIPYPYGNSRWNKYEMWLKWKKYVETNYRFENIPLGE